MNEILNKKISYYDNLTNVEQRKYKTIFEVLEIIKSEQHKDLIQKIRNEKEKSIRTKYKRFLPAVIFQGLFKKRNKESLEEVSQVACFDYDKTENVENIIKNDKYVLSAFKSPSGGWKILVVFDKIDENNPYEHYYNAFLSYFKDKGVNLDIATSDISRLCFLSYDPELYLNENSEVWKNKNSEKLKNTESETNFTTRSENEMSEVNKLVLAGKNKEEIWQHMSTFEKWSGKTESYREMTYQKALEFCKNKKNISNVEKDDIETSLINNDDFLVEQVFYQNEVKYAIFDKKNKIINYQNEFEYDGMKYKPIIDEEVEKGFVKLPTEALPYGNDEKLKEELTDFINKWLDVEKRYLTYAVYNIMKSWVYERFHTINYLRAMGDFGTGKSRFLDTLGYLHYKPIATSGALTSAVLFRLITKWKGTLIIDEADRKNTDETDDVTTIINQGYEKGRPVMRCNKENSNKVEFFDTYCPKIIGTRRQFQDKATESRCMTYVMKMTNRKDIPVNLNDDFEKEIEILRNKLLMWRFNKFDSINPKAGEKVDFGSIEPRLKQVNQGFVALFADDKEQLNNFIEHLNNYQKELVEERAEGVEGRIVKAVHEIINKDSLLTALNIIQIADFTDKSGELWNPRRLSKYMKQLGFNTTKQKKVGGVNFKIYEENDEFLEKLYNKYIVDYQNGNQVTKVTELLQTDLERLPLGENVKKSGEKHISSVSVTKVTTVTRLPFEEIKQIIEEVGEIKFENAIKYENGEQIYKKLIETGDYFESPSGILRKL